MLGSLHRHGTPPAGSKFPVQFLTIPLWEFQCDVLLMLRRCAGCSGAGGCIHRQRGLTNAAVSQVALEQRNADWRIAEVARQGLQRAAARRSELGARHAEEVALVHVGA